MENIYFTIGIIALVSVIGIGIYNFFKLEKSKRIEVIKEWLLFAVIEAEKYFGDGTGKIKLRYVYNMFIDKFKFMSLIISFDQFSILVDEVLENMREMLSDNIKVKEYITGGKEC